jgi:hypothetical protein
MKKITGYLAIGSTLLPLMAFASNKTLNDLVATAAGYLNEALALLMGLAVVMFVWYVIKYFIQPSEKARSEGSQYVMWSVIGFFVIFSMWGIVNILISTFDLGSNSAGSWANMSNLFPQ